MTDQEPKDVEHEKTKSYELGHISQLENTAELLRERAGERWANANGRVEVENSRQLKQLADELAEQAKEKREEWDGKYD